MLYVHRGQSELSGYVDSFWIAESYAQRHAQELVLPTGGMSLVINLDAANADAAVIWGARSKPLVLDTSRPLRLMAAHFAAGRGFPFASCPAGMLRNEHVSLAEFWPSEGADLCERIANAATNRERFLALELFLTARVQASRPCTDAVRFALRELQVAGPAKPVADLVDRMGLSSQRFIDVFRNEVGLTPKLFARLTRFRRAIQTIDATPDLDWASLAVATGYFDQPHLIRDFNEFAGVSPSAYLSRRISLNHVALART
jgi:AraC-like DNA-binding protein